MAVCSKNWTGLTRSTAREILREAIVSPCVVGRFADLDPSKPRDARGTRANLTAHCGRRGARKPPRGIRSHPTPDDDRGREHLGPRRYRRGYPPYLRPRLLR